MHVNSEEDWASLLKHAGPHRVIVVDWFATWCGPCKAIAPVIDQSSLMWSHVLFVKVQYTPSHAACALSARCTIATNNGNNAQVDGDECQELAMQAGIKAFPTFHLYRGGKRLEVMEGADSNRLAALITKHANQHSKSVDLLPLPPFAPIPTL